METHDFALVCDLPDGTLDEIADRAFQAGFDDGLVSSSRLRLVIDVTRDAPTMASALSSALEQAAAAGLRVRRVEPDPLVSVSDIADRAGLTRQAVSLYASRRRGERFPAPVARVRAESPLYDWAAVADWLHDRGLVDRATVEAASALRAINRSLAVDAIPA